MIWRHAAATTIAMTMYSSGRMSMVSVLAAGASQIAAIQMTMSVITIAREGH